jgi:Helicase associated domain
MGHCRVPDDYNENGFALGSWVGVQRRNRETLSKERRRRLDEIGFVWEAFPLNWERGFDYLNIYKEREGHCRVPQRYKEYGFPLGTWVSHQRLGKDKLSQQRRARLDKLGFDWNPFEAVWEKGFKHLQFYKERMGHCRVPGKYNENSYTLGVWVDSQRQKRQMLSENQKRRLDELGFVWDIPQAAWEEGFRFLAFYRKRDGHCRVPATWRENGYGLGHWVRTQRRNRNTMSAERKKRLDEIGFVWDVSRTY